MILIIHDNDIDSLKVLGSLSVSKIPHYSLELSELIQGVSIDSILEKTHKKCYWNKDGTLINLSNTSGIYFMCSYLSDDRFKSFADTDAEYAKNEWMAYLIYELSVHSNCISSIRMEFDITLFSLISVYNLATQLNMEVPAYKVGSQLLNKQSDDCIIYKKSLYDWHNYQSINYTENNMLSLALQKGVQVVSFVVGSKIISQIHYKDKIELFDLPQHIKESCIKLVSVLKARVAEMLFIRTLDDRYILYHVSPFPNWRIARNQCWNLLSNAIITELSAAQ